MAVSLISTGVQFPDSTIQTTAATASSPPGLVLLSAATISSGTATVDITTGVFSSTYDAYFIIMQGSASANSTVYMYFILDGTVITSGNPYQGVYLYAQSGYSTGTIYNNYYVVATPVASGQFVSNILISGTTTSGRASAWANATGQATSGTVLTTSGGKFLTNSFTTFTGVRFGFDDGGTGVTFNTTKYAVYGYKKS